MRCVSGRAAQSQAFGLRSARLPALQADPCLIGRSTPRAFEVPLAIFLAVAVAHAGGGADVVGLRLKDQ